MSGRVIQARYLGGLPGSQLVQMRPVGAPPLAGTVQAKGRPGLAGPPPLAGLALQAHGAAESFAVDPVRLGLGQGRGNPLPDAVRAKMEAAFGTDFSRVRVHEGPQAARIGAIAFTTGHDIYFAPGQYRPETVQGQQLLGHELAHVVQQCQGRVQAPGSGVSVVQDHALEAEADRLGMRAALHNSAVQPKLNAASILQRAARGVWATGVTAAVLAPITPEQQADLVDQLEATRVAQMAATEARDDQTALNAILNFIDPSNMVPDGSHNRENYYMGRTWSYDRLIRVQALWDALGVGYHSYDPDQNHPRQFHFLRPTIGRAGYNDNVHVNHS